MTMSKENYIPKCSISRARCFMFYRENIRIIEINVALYGILALDIKVLKGKNYKCLIKMSSDILALFSTFT